MLKNRFKQIIKNISIVFINLMNATRFGRYFQELVIRSAMERSVRLTHKGHDFTFASPNSLCRWRYETFASKEPETLEWIDAMSVGSNVWDIGANVGLYSIYAAKHRGCHVSAFEPSVFNLELLARNIFLNRVVDRVCIVPIALSDKVAASHMKMTSMEWGGALSTFGEDYGWDGKTLKSVFEYKTVGLRMVDALELLSLPPPDYIKIDVDGIEHLILAGGQSILAKVKEVLIEVNDAFAEQSLQCQQSLIQAGLMLREKRQSEMVSISSEGFDRAYNQIWVRQ